MPDVSRAALREMYFYESGKQAERFARTRQALGRLLEEVVAAAAGRGLIRTAEAPGCVAGVIFAIFQVHLRRWLADDAPVVDEAMETLGRQIRVVMQGLSPRPEAFSAERAPAAKDGVDAVPDRRAS